MIFVTESYKVIDGYQSYSVSTFGNVKNIKTGRVLKGRCLAKGYLGVCLYKNGKMNNLRIHRLVADSFLEKINGSRLVNHINGVKTDNRLVNLEWVTNRENCCHAAASKVSTSKYVGVYYRSESNKWISTIHIGRKKKHLGWFDTEKEAYQCRVKYEKENGIVNKYL